MNTITIGHVETVKAPAKVNLVLRVVGKRTDGYHDLEMLMQRIDLCDEVSVCLREKGGVSVSCPGLNLAVDDENIAARAARVMLDKVDTPVGVEIKIVKNIPAAAGLGGGSSDAAAVIILLNRMLKLDLSLSELILIGVKIGADVPFFIFKKTAWARGVGEKLQLAENMPEIWYLIANLGIEIPTGSIFEKFQLTEKHYLTKLPPLLTYLSDVTNLLRNDLEQVVFQDYPQVEELKAKILDAGALGALMAGSGSTVFGVFGSLSAANVAKDKLKQNGLFLAVAKGLP